MILSVICSLGLLGPQEPAAPVVEYEVSLSQMLIEGEPFEATVSIVCNSAAGIPAWALSPAAFEIDGQPLVPREAEGTLNLAAGQRLTSTFDIGQALQAAPGFVPNGLALEFAFKEDATYPVQVLISAEMGIDFMTLPVEQLSDYQVVLMSIHGPIGLKFWTDVAPNHCRNFLDLAYTGFYDDTHFHRVVPGFMIQGGGAKPDKPAPRRLKNEFNKRRHVAGVLSMARMGVDTKDENGNVIPAFDSATSEFFIMDAVYPSLDGKYTGFGEVVFGMDAVKKVVDSVKGTYHPRNPRTQRPPVRQSVSRVMVIKSPAEQPEASESK